MLRFQEVTQALADALRRETPQQQVLGADALAFRLDGAIHHLLLDEFQDTSLTQWHVLKPIAQRITRKGNKTPGSFFCVGDVKQAIYGWRGGMAAIFDTLNDCLGKLKESPLLKSRRSAQPIIDVVNDVFGNLEQCQEFDNCQDGLRAWAQRFERHATVKEKVTGYVCLHTGPAMKDGEPVAMQRLEHCKYVAKQVQDLLPKAAGHSIGILCRKNDTVARMIFELRNLEIEASEEGGNPLTDSAAVELMLALWTLADHPGHSIAWFHLRNSFLKDHFKVFSDADSCAKQLRQELLASGNGVFAQRWATRLAPACDERDLRRLQQLVEIAYGYQARATLRADDFIAWVRQQRVPDPSGANIRVMTIHSAKGLQFEVVILPELDANLLGQAPTIVEGRDPKTLDVRFICRYASEDIQGLLVPEQRRAFEEDRQHRIEESLSLLYVAMTRAVRALHMYLPGHRFRKSDSKDAWYKLLRQTLKLDSPKEECKLVFEHGDANWSEHLPTLLAPERTPIPPPFAGIVFAADATNRRRGLEHVAPSQREGQGKVALHRLFQPGEGTGTAAGTLFHAWFASIAWIDDGVPTEAALRTIAEKMRTNLPPSIWVNLDFFLANFQKWLQEAVIHSVLRRSAYASVQEAGFPAKFAPFWNNLLKPQQVERERRFLVPDGETFLNGSLDRVVWLGVGNQIIAADVIDFKTDAIPPGDDEALAARVEHYRPQMEVYRRAVVSMSRLPAERVATRLVFPSAARVIELFR